MKSQTMEATYTTTTNEKGETVITATINEDDDPIITPGECIDDVSEMSIGASFGPFKRQPVHETMTLAALIASDLKLDPSMTYNKAIKDYHKDTLEFLRGIVWNDDPENELFSDGWLFNNDNFFRGTGADWLMRFGKGKLPGADCTKDGFIGSTNLIARSHFGDLQFLHSMADKEGENPQDTQRKIVAWLEIMYKVAIGQISKDTRLRDVDLGHGDEQERYPLRRLFNGSTAPKDTDSIHTLLTSNTSYKHVMHDRRALGSCLHVIQDSYARGHCHRRTQYNGIPKQYADVMNFHSYKGQDSHDHDRFDFGDRDMENVNCADISQFNDMDGCTDAIRQCTKLINFWLKKTPWEENVWAWLQNDIFQIAHNATPSNTEVN
ncbi:hypothetical protein BC939DRAFT_30372 [Gamsiella multidivaricata]|uniref:uncharacterized protein n=1 Tax=Gamsiella multidivaricata TaxID=101098 RepID=UPI00221ED715|nr:uncharacterized protein BC939DRAFT_30361 [Gamsiella multidivaricata]XP_051406868.1 uncharacterized protein BC939DRAFT_30372 [Gamsiella multidivaricata]KAG0352376.1 hypothetical protein BGZ54_002817 [Gamsiella multidivaricata]KAI7816796.1 hypothetical protein BC939DRAFT_30361 [Gamsiella multidivaricata]KAI7816797.1 hypothetical protein BC939DRAFT_30372 [Gamsiella multidivaricata]